MKHVLVTGGAGFIGSHLTESLLNDGYAVRVVDNESTGRRENLAKVWDHPQLEFIAGTVTDPDLVRNVVQDCHMVFHLAAAVGVALVDRDPIETVEQNIRPAALLLQELRRVREQQGHPIRFFLASSSEVYGKNPKELWNEEDELHFGPTTCMRWSYGMSKAIDEFLTLAHCQQHGLSVVVARFFNVAGPRQTGSYGMVLPRFVKAALAGEPLVVHDDGLQERCFAHVSDVVAAVRALMESPQAIGNVFNIGTDEAVTILQLAYRVIDRAQSPSCVTFQPYSDAYSANFQDVRRRIPNLSKLRSTVTVRPKYCLNDIIDELIQ